MLGPTEIESHNKELIREAWALTLYRSALHVPTPITYLCLRPSPASEVCLPPGTEKVASVRLHLIVDCDSSNFQPFDAGFVASYRAHAQAAPAARYLIYTARGMLPLHGIGSLLAAAALLDDFECLNATGFIIVENDKGEPSHCQLVKGSAGTALAPREDKPKRPPLNYSALTETDQAEFIDTLKLAFTDFSEARLNELLTQSVPHDTPVLTYASLSALSAGVHGRLASMVRNFRHLLDASIVAEWELAAERLARAAVARETPLAESAEQYELLRQRFSALRGRLTREPGCDDNDEPSCDGAITFQVPPDPNIIGRSKELAALHGSLTRNGGSVISQTMAGIGGVGKTTLAAAFTNQAVHSQVLGYHYVAWFRAEDEKELEMQFAGLLKLWFKVEVQDTAEAVNLAWTYISDMPSKVLMVFDNVTDLPTLSGILSASLTASESNAEIHVIATTRDVRERDGFAMLRIESFSLEDTDAYVIEHFPDGPTQTDSVVEQLHLVVGGMPLALAQVAGFMRSTGLSLHDTLSRFAANQTELLFHGTLSDAAHPRTVGTLVVLAIAHLKLHCPLALDVLEVAAYFQPDGASTCLLQDVTCDQRQVFLQAFESLQSLGLLESVSGATYNIHRLIQQCVRQCLKEKCIALFTMYKDRPDCKFRDWIPALEHAFEFILVDNAVKAKLAVYVSRVKRNLFGNANEKIQGFALAYWYDRVTGTKLFNDVSLEMVYNAMIVQFCPDLLDVSLDMPWPMTLETLTAAIQLHKLVESSLGTTDERSVALLSKIARVQRHLSLFDESLKTYSKLLLADSTCRYKGTLNYGVALNSVGRTADAVVALEEGLAFIENFCFGDSGDMVMLRAMRLVVDQPSTPETRKAELYERILTIQRKVFGVDHHRTLEALLDLASFYESRNDVPRAIQCFEQELDVVRSPCERILILLRLAPLYGRIGLKNKDEDAVRSGFDLAITCARAECVELYAAVNKLGVKYATDGDHARECILMEYAIVLAERGYGRRHPTTATALRNLGVAHHWLGEPETARALLEEALAIRQRLLGPHHADVVNIYFDITFICRDLGDDHGEYGNLVNLKCANTTGKLDLDTIKNLGHLAVLCNHRNEHERASSLFARVLVAFEDHFKGDFNSMIQDRFGANIPAFRKHEYLLGLAGAAVAKYGADHEAVRLFREAAEGIAVYPLPRDAVAYQTQ